VTLTGRLDHRLAPVDGYDRTAGRDELRKRRGVVPEPTTDLKYSAPGNGAEQFITLALAVGEKRERVNQRQTTREQREIRGAVDALKSRSEVIGHVFPLSSSIHSLLRGEFGSRNSEDRIVHAW